MEDRSEPERDAEGRVVGIWGIVRDITERREREDAASQLAAPPSLLPRRTPSWGWSRTGRS